MENVVSDSNALSKNLEFLLKKNGLSLSQLSQACGVDKPIISRILNGKTTNPQVDTLKPIAEFFDITIDQLIGVGKTAAEKQYGVVVPIDRLLVPLIEWKHIPYWREIKDSYNPKKTIDARITGSKDSFAIEIDNNKYEPVFSCGCIIIIDPSIDPKNRDYILTSDENSALPTIEQLIIENDKTFLKTIDSKLNIKKITKLICFGVVTESHLNLAT